MSEFSLRLSPSLPLIDSLNSYPPTVRAFLREGFKATARLNREQRGQIADAAVESLRSHGGPDDASLSQRLGLTEDESKQVLAAATFLAASISTRKEPPSAIIAAIIQAGIAEQAQIEVLQGLGDNLSKQRLVVAEALERFRIGSAVLPSLTDFSATIDVRLSFKNKVVENSVPVAVVHLDTDAIDHEVWFQMTHLEVEKLIADLNNVLEQLKGAEQWVTRR